MITCPFYASTGHTVVQCPNIDPAQVPTPVLRDWTPLDLPYTYLDRPLWWHTQGLSQTRTGYGTRLTSDRCVRLADGRTRRVYVTQFSNAGTAWIVLDGCRRIVQ